MVNINVYVDMRISFATVIYRIELCIYTRFLQSPTLGSGQMPVNFVSLLFLFGIPFTLVWLMYISRSDSFGSPCAAFLGMWYTYVVVAAKIYF